MQSGPGRNRGAHAETTRWPGLAAEETAVVADHGSHRDLYIYVGHVENRCQSVLRRQSSQSSKQTSKRTSKRTSRETSQCKKHLQYGWV